MKVTTTVCSRCKNPNTTVVSFAVEGEESPDFDLCDGCRADFRAVMAEWMEIARRQDDGIEDAFPGMADRDDEALADRDDEALDVPEVPEAPELDVWMPEVPDGIQPPPIAVGAAWWVTPKDTTQAQRQAFAAWRAGLWTWGKQERVSGKRRFPKLIGDRPGRGAFPADVGRAWTEEVWFPRQSGGARRPKVESLNGAALRMPSRRRR